MDGLEHRAVRFRPHSLTESVTKYDSTMIQYTHALGVCRVHYLANIDKFEVYEQNTGDVQRLPLNIFRRLFKEVDPSIIPTK